jgi:hypothetical protein
MDFTVKLRTLVPVVNLDAMANKDAFLTATFTDIKVLPFSGIIRYFGEFWKYDENGNQIPGSMVEVETYNKKEELPIAVVDYLFSAIPVDFTQNSFSVNLLTFIKTAFVQKVAADGRYGLTVSDVELITVV